LLKEIQLRLDKEGTRAVLHDLEAEVMDVIWDSDAERVSVADVREALEPDCDRAYTTVMTTLKRLHEKELLDRQKSGRKYLYSARLSRSEFHRQLAMQLMETMPNSGEESAMSYLVEQVASSDEETLDRLEKLIEERRGELDS
jgi:predicted transcriptional regulator